MLRTGAYVLPPHKKDPLSTRPLSPTLSRRVAENASPTCNRIARRIALHLAKKTPRLVKINRGSGVANGDRANRYGAFIRRVIRASRIAYDFATDPCVTEMKISAESREETPLRGFSFELKDVSSSGGNTQSDRTERENDLINCPTIRFYSPRTSRRSLDILACFIGRVLHTSHTRARARVCE